MIDRCNPSRSINPRRWPAHCGDGHFPLSAPITLSAFTPSGLVFTYATADESFLDWTYAGSDHLGFEIWRQSNGGAGGWVWWENTGTTSERLNIDEPLPDQFAYKVRAFAAAGVSNWTNLAYSPPLTPTVQSVAQSGSDFILGYTHPGWTGNGWLGGNCIECETQLDTNPYAFFGFDNSAQESFQGLHGGTPGQVFTGRVRAIAPDGNVSDYAGNFFTIL